MKAYTIIDLQVFKETQDLVAFVEKPNAANPLEIIVLFLFSLPPLAKHTLDIDQAWWEDRSTIPMNYLLIGFGYQKRYLQHDP